MGRSARAAGPVRGVSARAIRPARPVLALATLLVLATPVASPATHLPDHRFVVVGFLTDALGRPVANAPVVITRRRTGLEYPTRTERDGFYLVVVHLHDEDEGDVLTIRAPGATGEIRARFDPRDRKVERGTQVDIREGQVVERRAAFAETLRAYLTR